MTGEAIKACFPLAVWLLDMVLNTVLVLGSHNVLCLLDDDVMSNAWSSC